MGSEVVIDVLDSPGTKQGLALWFLGSNPVGTKSNQAPCKAQRLLIYGGPTGIRTQNPGIMSPLR